jgi:hypothetical protein
VAGVADARAAEEQLVAQRIHVLAVLQELEVPGAVDRVAVEHASHDAVVAQHELLIDPPAGIVQHDLLVALRRGERAGGEQVDTGYFQFR